MKHEMAERLVERGFAGDPLVESSGPISVDLAVFTLAGRELSVLLTERTEAPYPGFWSLPGTLRQPGVSLDTQARALQNAVTGIDGGWSEQLTTFDPPRAEQGRLFHRHLPAAPLALHRRRAGAGFLTRSRPLHQPRGPLA